jgi:hypothetical protein
MKRTGVLIAIAAAMLSPSPALADEFQARLGRIPVDSRTQSAIAGLGHATAELDGNRLRIQGDFSGMLGAVTAANLHLSAAVGIRGPVIHALEVDGTNEGELEGSIRLSDDEVAALRAGRLYIQIHSEIAPDGNLWGWLLGE